MLMLGTLRAESKVSTVVHRERAQGISNLILPSHVQIPLPLSPVHGNGAGISPPTPSILHVQRQSNARFCPQPVGTPGAVDGREMRLNERAVSHQKKTRQ